MIHIMSGHRFNNGLESHVSALRVRNLFGAVFRLRVPDQRQVPSANGGKGCQRRRSIVGGIGDGPFLLIKRLNYMVVFSQRLPQAKRKSDLAVSQMAEDFPRIPFAWSRRFLHSLRSKLVEQRC